MKLAALFCPVALLGLAACDDMATDAMSEPMRTGTSAAESACVAAVNTNYGRAVGSVKSSDYSEAGTIVMVGAEGETFRCLASNDGTVEDLAAAN